MMMLNLFDDLQKISDDFKNWLINSDSWIMLVFFFGFFLLFIIGWNIIHKHD